MIATAVVAGALARERDAAGRHAGSFERILSSLHSVVLTEQVWPDESAETLFLGPGYERLLGRPVTPETAPRRTRRCTPTTGGGGGNAAYTVLAHGRETTVDWRVPRPIAGHRWLRTRLMPRRPVGDGDPVIVDGLIADVTREREILAALAEQGEVVERLTSSIAESVYTLELRRRRARAAVPASRSPRSPAATRPMPRTRRGRTASTPTTGTCWTACARTAGRSSTG